MRTIISIEMKVQSRPSVWCQFIQQSISINCQNQLDASTSMFPKLQIINFCTNHSPSLKQLLHLLPIVFQKYLNDVKCFKQLIVLMYLLVIKGSSAKILYDYGVNLIQSLLTYRAWLLCADQFGKPIIVETYQYFEQWLSIFIPSLLKLKQSSQILMKSIQKIAIQKKSHSKFKSHKIQTQFSQINAIDKNNYFTEVQDNVLIIFESLFLEKIRQNLTAQSCWQFDQFLKQTYTENEYKVLSYSFYNENTQNLHLLHAAASDSPVQDDLVRLENLFFIKQSDETLELSNLLIFNKYSSELNLISSENSIQNWVLQSHFSQPEPVQLSKVNSMKTLQLFNFLQCLQIYGSSPKIEVLNQYITDEQFLDFFSLFLLGEQLTQNNYIYGNQKWRIQLYEYLKQFSKLNKTQRSILCHQIKNQLLDAFTGDNEYLQQTNIN